MKRRRRRQPFPLRKLAAGIAAMALVCFAFRLLSGGNLPAVSARRSALSPSREKILQRIALLGTGGDLFWEDLGHLFRNDAAGDEAGQVLSPPYFEADDREDPAGTPSEEITTDPAEAADTPADPSTPAENAEPSVPTAPPEAPAIPEDVFSGPLTADGIHLDNDTDYAPDLEALLNEPLDLPLPADGPAVLIVHTHGSESYMPDGTYTESDPYRTTDAAHNVTGLGEVLASELTRYGISVIHDTNLYDYPAYSGSYQRSMEAIDGWLAAYPNIVAVIDLHRDAISDAQGRQYKTVAQVGDTTCSQVLLIAGTDFSGLEHPDWMENLKLAVHLQYAMNRMFPSLAKPINLSKYRYNQQATHGSVIVEMGCTGNTYEEARAATVYFAEAFAEVLTHPGPDA